MEKDSSEDEMNSSLNGEDSGKDMSFVTKVRSRMSGLFNSSITRLFGNQGRSSLVRRRESDEFCESQPPRKRAKQFENNYPRNSNHVATETSNLDGLSNPTTFNFIEPIPGTSGLRPQMNWNKRFTATLAKPSELSNDDKDSESGESTSGYSSMPKLSSRQQQQASENLNVSVLEENKSSASKSIFEVSSTPITPDRSLFSERSLFPDRSPSPQIKNTSLSSRRPSFNASSFGSPNFVDRTITTSRIINSPFYNGPTTFGGASAYDKKAGFNETLKQQMKKSFLVKPVNKSSENNSSTSLSKTARRILETLEQYSTPMDVKKNILTSKIRRPEGVLSRYLGANPYDIRKSKVASNKELQVPTTPELLKMKQKQKLQDTTDQIRQIATSSSSSISEEYKIGEDNQQKYTNKMKTKISSVRNKAPTVEILEDIVLNPIPLTIPADKLPKFDLELPPPETPKISKVVSQKCNETKSVVVDVPPKSSTKTEDYASEFIFSNPLIIADNLKSIVAINNFKFSEPVCRKIIPEKETKKVENKINNGDISRNVAQNVIECLKYTKDPLMEKFKAPEGSWECSTCLIQNKANAVKCIACETLRLKDASKPVPKPNLPGFGIQFNKKSDEWECTTCLVRNKLSNGKCVACGILRPSTITKTNGFGDHFRMTSNEWECHTCLIRNKIELTKCAACETPRSPVKTGFGDKFKPPAGTWECQTCLIQNKASVTKCIACESPKIGAKSDFGTQVRPPNVTWECDTCLIRNKTELKNCAACQTPKDKIVPAKTETVKILAEKWECPTCLVRNNNDVEKCPCCETTKPGCAPKITKNDVNMFNFGVSKSQFNFGIPKVEKNENQISNSVLGSTVPGISFGVKSDGNEIKTENKTINILPELKPNVGLIPFTFGIPSTTASKPSEAKEKPSFGFKAQTTTVESNTIPSFTTTTTTSTNFNFGTPSTTSANIASKPLINFDSSTKPLVTPVENKTPTTPSLTPGNKSTFRVPKEMFTGVNTAAAPPVFSFGKNENSSVAAPNKPPLFSFGSTSATAPDSKGFNFAPTALPKTNNVGQPSSGFTFNAPKTATNVFPNSTTAAPKNGGFNFGNPAVNNNQAAVFSFGATQNLPQTASNMTQPSTKGFNFTAPPAAPNSGFNLGAPTFDSNVKPSFNFTGGNIPTFAATPTEGGGAAPVRKFKKAVRRAAQR